MSAPANVLDPGEVVVGINNGPGIYLAPEGTKAPEDLAAVWPAPWDALGYISNDGVAVSAAVESEVLTPWQSVSPIRTLVTGRSFTMQFVLWQTNPRNLALYFDTAKPEGNSFDVRSDEGGYVYTLAIDARDGDNVMRLVFPRAQLSDNGDVAIQRGAAIGWDVTMSALDSAGVLAHIITGTVSDAQGGNGGEETLRRTTVPSKAA